MQFELFQDSGYKFQVSGYKALIACNLTTCDLQPAT